MTCTIMQPAYLPWLGFFERIEISDLFILLDHVEIDRNSKTKFANRNKIRTPQGWQWLTVPIVTKGVKSLRLCELKIEQTSKWANQHRTALQHNYGKAPHFQEHREYFENCYSKKWENLEPLCSETTNYLLKELQISTPIIRSSKLNVKGTSEELIRNICREVEADKYISGPFGRDYLDLKKFQEASIQVLFHDYVHPNYKQTNTGFEPFMSAIDLLFNLGSCSKNILRASKPQLSEK